MSFTGRAKDSFKRAYAQGQLMWHWYDHTKQMRELIRASSDPLPELTKAQKREINTYWSKHGYNLKSTLEHRFYYGKTGNHDPRFIPAPLWFYAIIPRLNPIELSKAWEDKARLSEILRGLPTPEQVLYNSGGHFFDGDGAPLSRAAAADKLKEYDRLVFKPTIDSGVGRNVNLYTAPFSAGELFSKYGKNFSVQLPIQQSEKTAKFNSSSVNSLRITSFFWKNRIHLSDTILFKVGPPDRFTDNDITTDGRRLIGVDPDGSLKERGVDFCCNWYNCTKTGIPFAGFTIPNFSQLKTLIQTAHQRFPHFGVIGWDICLDLNDKPIIIEANISSPGIFIEQLANSTPVFGDLTDEILAYCSPRRGHRHG